MKQVLSLILLLPFFHAFGQLPIYNYSSGTWNTTNMSINNGLQLTRTAAFNKAFEDLLKKDLANKRQNSRRYTSPLPTNRRSVNSTRNLVPLRTSFYRSFSCMTCETLSNKGDKPASYYRDLIFQFDTELLLIGYQSDDLLDMLTQVFQMAWSVKNQGQQLNQAQRNSVRELILEGMKSPTDKIARGSDQEKQQQYEKFAVTAMQMMKYNRSAYSKVFALRRATELMQASLHPLRIHNYRLTRTGFELK